MVQNPTYQEVKLVHAEVVDVSPLAAEREEASIEELGSEIRGVGGDERGDGGGERGLVEGSIGVPEAKEEPLPDLEESGGGESGERREERGEDPHAAIPHRGLGRGEELGDGGGGGSRRRRRHRRYISGGEREGHDAGVELGIRVWRERRERENTINSSGFLKSAI